MGDNEEFKQSECGKKCSKACLIPQRVILSIIGVFAIVSCYTHRYCLSLVITVLVVKKNLTNVHEDDICVDKMERVIDKIDENSDDAHTFDWSEDLQGFVLASFYIGYVISHIPGGIIADKYGAKWVLICGLLVSAITTLISPICTKEGGSNGLIVCRVFMGLGQGVVFPALSCWLATWIPASERSKFGAFVMSGGIIGAIIACSTSGIMLHYNSWEFLFYIYGGITFIWCILAIILCSSYPVDHPFIKEKEIDYLRKEMGHIGPVEKPPLPVKDILTSCPVYAMIFGQIGHDWGIFTIIIDLPKYLNDVLFISIGRNGLYLALLFTILWIVAMVAGVLADCLTNREKMTLVNVRKMMTAIAAFGPGIFMVGASYAGCDEALSISLFAISMGLMGPYYCGVKLTPLDLSPNFAGTLMAIGNGVGSLMGILVPYLIGVMTPNSTLLEWRIAFWLAFAILSASAFIFCIWASADVQPFDAGEAKKENKKEP